MYTELFGSSDRLGGNIVDIISQIIFCVKNGIFIKYDRNYLRIYNSFNQKYNSSIFLQTLFDSIDFHNESLGECKFDEFIDLATPSHFEIWSKTVIDSQVDLITFFREKIYTQEIREKFINRSKKLQYEVPFDPEETLLIHHRLEDVRDREDYDGSICANYMCELIESGVAPNESVLTSDYPPPKCQMQSPLSSSKIISQVNKVLDKNSNLRVILVTSPNENLSGLPYEVLSSCDEYYDLFLLSSCKNLILSRSNFALSSLFFGIEKHANIPLWGHLPCYGLYTKFDKNQNFKYFT